MKTINISPGFHFRDIIKKGDYNLDDESIYFLLPDIPSTVQAEQVFIEQNGLWGDRLLTFAKLAGTVNISANTPPNLVSRTARLLLIEQVISDLLPEFEYYKEIVDKREFSDSVLRVIAEIKHSNSSASELLSLFSGITSEKLKLKIADFCKVYSQYDNKLKSINHIDDIDALRLLIDKINNKKFHKSFSELKKIIVFGFNEFTDAQREVLDCLDKNGIEIDFYYYDFSKNNNQKNIVIKPFNSIVEESQHCIKKIKSLIENENIEPSKIAVIIKNNYPNSLIIKEEFDKSVIDYSENSNSTLKSSLIGKLILSIINLKISNFKTTYLLQFLRNPYVINFFGDVDKYYRYIADLELYFLKHKITSVPLSKSRRAEYLEKWNNSKFVNSLLNLLGQINKNISSKNILKLNNGLMLILEEIVFRNFKKSKLIKSVPEVNALKSAFNILTEYRFIINKFFSDKNVENVYEYYSFVSDLISDRKYSLTAAHEENKVKKLDFLEARGTAFDYIFVLGASENAIPNIKSVDPVFKNNERYELNKASGKKIFKTRSEVLQKEEELFDLIISSSQNTFVNFVRYDESGRIIQPSYFLNKYEVTNEKADIDEISTHQYSKGLSSSSDYNYENDQTSGSIRKEIIFIKNGLKSEIKRLKKLSVLQDNEGRVDGSVYLKKIKSFSVTQLETYGLCPFRYFASNVLKLSFPDEIVDEPHPLDLGSIYHRILNEFFSELSNSYGSKLDFRVISDEELLLTLDIVLVSMKIENEFYWLSDFRRIINIKSLVERIIPAFILKEAQRIRELNTKGFFPKEFEKELVLKLDDNDIQGKADRIDLSEDKALVIDYKFRSISDRSFSDYKNLQLPLYLNSFSDGTYGSYGGYYRSIEYPEKEVGKNIDSKDYYKYLEQSLEFAQLYINNIKAGIFPPCPQEKDVELYEDKFQIAKEKDAPCNFCEYSDLCRAKDGVLRTIK